MKTTAVTVLLLFAFSIVAQTPSLPAVDVTHGDIDAFFRALPPTEINDKPIRVVDVGGYHLAVYGVLRPKGPAQDANLHQTKVSEIYYILEGSGTLATGGTLPNAHPLKEGDKINLQSPTIKGGVRRRVTVGDVIIIPGYTPHQWIDQDGKLRYLIFRADPESRIPLK